MSSWPSDNRTAGLHRSSSCPAPCLLFPPCFKCGRYQLSFLFLALLTQKTLTNMCLSNLPTLSLPLSSSYSQPISVRPCTSRCIVLAVNIQFTETFILALLPHKPTTNSFPWHSYQWPCYHPQSHFWSHPLLNSNIQSVVKSSKIYLSIIWNPFFLFCSYCYPCWGLFHTLRTILTAS